MITTEYAINNAESELYVTTSMSDIIKRNSKREMKYIYSKH